MLIIDKVLVPLYDLWDFRLIGKYNKSMLFPIVKYLIKLPYVDWIF